MQYLGYNKDTKISDLYIPYADYLTKLIRPFYLKEVKGDKQKVEQDVREKEEIAELTPEEEREMAKLTPEEKQERCRRIQRACTNLYRIAGGDFRKNERFHILDQWMRVYKEPRKESCASKFDKDIIIDCRNLLRKRYKNRKTKEKKKYLLTP